MLGLEELAEIDRGMRDGSKGVRGGSLNLTPREPAGDCSPCACAAVSSSCAVRVRREREDSGLGLNSSPPGRSSFESGSTAPEHKLDLGKSRTSSQESATLAAHAPSLFR